jgi:hypothetical protein
MRAGRTACDSNGCLELNRQTCGSRIRLVLFEGKVYGKFALAAEGMVWR